MERSDGNKRKRAVVGVEERLICAFLNGCTWRAAAKYAKCSQHCIQRKMLDAAFLEKLSAARHELVRRAIDKVNSSALKAVGALVKMLNDPDSNVALKAAQTLLDACTKFATVQALEERLTNLEDVHKNRGRTIIDGD